MLPTCVGPCYALKWRRALGQCVKISLRHNPSMTALSTEPDEQSSSSVETDLMAMSLYSLPHNH